MDVQDSFMAPAGYGIVRDFDIKQLLHYHGRWRSRDGTDYCQKRHDGHCFFCEIHFVPGEWYCQVLEIDSFYGIFSYFKRSARKRYIDFVGTFFVSLGVVAIASQAKAIREMFEDGHICAALWAGK
ncbi:MAG: hypothetical protein GWN67_07020 [Phycisphaerae bacterium]|nr:hypothetical protein [candidate division KSB1 bacterium]NIU56133.1 hypothetical protein [Phycisphaerae bacterium]NIV69749.1 hypothetical protein [Phycisphaerae bacterium]NIW22093.1 hypothetical protein [candidate division KSB1 bacterium]